MKVLIWSFCIFAYALTTILFKEIGIRLGAIPLVIILSGMMWLGQTLCKKWDEQKANKKAAPPTPNPQSVIETMNNKFHFCKKCGEKLIDNSRFCSKCGTEMVKVPDCTGDISTGDTLKTILEIQAKTTIEAMEANNQSQPYHEGETEFGLVPENPILTLAQMSVDGEKEYLNRLYTTNGEKIKWNHRGSMNVDDINGMIDIYDTYLPSGQPYKTIYINMYSDKRSTKAPAGFVLNNTTTIKTQQIPKKEKAVKNRYCSRCGSAFNSKTKTCTRCGKTHFNGIRFNKFSVTVTVLTVVILAVSTLSVLQFVNNQELQNQIADLERQVSNKQSAIRNLQDRADSLLSQMWVDRELVNFIDNYVVFIEDDGTELYHKYECNKFKGESFWVFNIKAAEDNGYNKCPYCH